MESEKLIEGTSKFTPDWESSWIDSLIDVLEEKNISVVDFCKKCPNGAAFFEGRIPDIEDAKNIASIVGGFPDFWIRRSRGVSNE